MDNWYLNAAIFFKCIVIIIVYFSFSYTHLLI